MNKHIQITSILIFVVIIVLRLCAFYAFGHGSGSACIERCALGLLLILRTVTLVMMLFIMMIMLLAALSRIGGFGRGILLVFVIQNIFSLC